MTGFHGTAPLIIPKYRLLQAQMPAKAKFRTNTVTIHITRDANFLEVLVIKLKALMGITFSPIANQKFVLMAADEASCTGWPVVWPHLYCQNLKYPPDSHSMCANPAWKQQKQYWILWRKGMLYPLCEHTSGPWLCCAIVNWSSDCSVYW